MRYCFIMLSFVLGLMIAPNVYSYQCLSTNQVDSNKEFRFVDLSGDYFADLYVTMSCTEAETTKNHFVFGNDDFLTLDDFENFQLYKNKIERLSRTLEIGFEELKVSSAKELRGAIIGDAFTALGGAVSAIGCIGSWGALCGLGLTTLAGGYVNSSFSSVDDTHFNYALKYLNGVSEKRAVLIKESNYSSYKARYVNFVNYFCSEVKKQCVN